MNTFERRVLRDFAVRELREMIQAMWLLPKDTPVVILQLLADEMDDKLEKLKELAQ